MRVVQASGAPRAERGTAPRRSARQDAAAAFLAAGWARRQREAAWRNVAVGGALFTLVALGVGLFGPPSSAPAIVRAVITGGVFVGVYGPLGRNLAVRREHGTRAHHRDVTRRDPPWPAPPQPWPWWRVGALTVALVLLGLGLLVLLG